MFTIYHNTRCSKSRQTLGLLEDYTQSSKEDFTVIEYLKTPLTIQEIKQLLIQLNCKPIEMMRTKEALFNQLNLKKAEEDELLQAMVDNPKLIERPIVSNGISAIIGRPPENITMLFKQ
jgi:arsenate reductase|tara:strand:+ start:372 stop:728 length:357 start_codon:yes stop_codon:yes gene_type:complete